MDLEKAHIHRLLDLCQELIELAVEGSEAADDEGCLLLYGVVQDCAYKMRKAGKEELIAHERRSQPAGK
jgi:hypothetical protein